MKRRELLGNDVTKAKKSSRGTFRLVGQKGDILFSDACTTVSLEFTLWYLYRPQTNTKK
jgi:hypothetical protein